MRYRMIVSMRLQKAREGMRRGLGTYLDVAEGGVKGHRHSCELTQVSQCDLSIDLPC